MVQIKSQPSKQRVEEEDPSFEHKFGYKRNANVLEPKLIEADMKANALEKIYRKANVLKYQLDKVIGPSDFRQEELYDKSGASGQYMKHQPSLKKL